MKNTKFVFLTILIIALLVVMIISLVKICTTQKKTTQVEDDTMLIEIESHLSYVIMYDKDTKVMYYQGTSNEADLCPLYNADGSLKLYSGG